MRANRIDKHNAAGASASAFFFVMSVAAGGILLSGDNYAHGPHEPDPFVFVT